MHNALPLNIIENEDFLVKEDYGIIIHKGHPIAIKDGNVIVFRSDSQEFLDYIIDFLKTFKTRLEVIHDPYKPTRIAFKLNLRNKTFYCGFGRLNFFEYKYILAKLKELGILPVVNKTFFNEIKNSYEEIIKWLY